MDSESKVFTLSRLAVLATATLVTLSSGTNYVVSAYAPQLGSRLHLSHTQLNIVAVAGNVGVYTSGPFTGRIMDTRGPRPLLIASFVCLLSGYLTIRAMYDAGLDEGEENLRRGHLLLLIFASYLTGVGSNSGMASAMNSTAKSFPDRLRAIVVGIVMSGFGLSAFFFSTLSHLLFPGNTSDFLLVLALGTALPMILGFFFVRPLPLPTHPPYRRLSFDAPRPVPRSTSQTRLLLSDDDDDASDAQPPPPTDAAYTEFSRAPALLLPDSVQLSPSSGREHVHRRSRSRSAAPSHRGAGALPGEKLAEGRGVDLHASALWTSLDFWILCGINMLFSGTGLMYINNVGSIAQALFARGNPAYDPLAASVWQAAQVSALSLTNFAGRILIGLAADATKARARLPRSCCLALVAALFVLAQGVLLRTQDVAHLWVASAALGLAYGGLFGLLPTLCIELFGLAHFSENWGYVSLFPVVGGNLFSLAFGRNLDAHSPHADIDAAPPAPLPAASSVPSPLARALPAAPELTCLDGRACYVHSLYLTLGACLLASVLALWLARRDWVDRKSRVVAYEEVLWEEDGEDEDVRP
ncbi:major facilitator superfamily domain-containing protein [Amylostereum chailletii]|nr:major facilitator superfamily domain-containing protein [Amylostereum chailletii]